MTTLEDYVVEQLTTIDTTVDLDESDLTPIQEFYNNTKVFITGSTGFLGIILLEKLLRSCPVSTIYLLVRNKKGKSLETRLDELFNDVAFQRIEKQHPKFREKVVGIAGECSQPDLGLSAQDKQMLIDEVNVIFHVAATVRFDEKLTNAVFINVRATRDILRFAQQMPKLKSFIHISTLYANCVQKVIGEKIYPAAMNYKGLISMAENIPDILEEITPSLVDKYPNTYVFTKQIAEDVVRQEGRGLPVALHRPAIVISSYKEPVRGWINNLYGATGVAVGAGLGLLKVLYCDPASNANMVPVDMCVNSMIATGWDVGKTFMEASEKRQKIPVYNFESSNDKPIDWRYYMDKISTYGLRFPSTQCIWYYYFSLQTSYPIYFTLTFLLHTIPGILTDGLLLCLGKSPRMVKAYKKIHKFSAVISYFCLKEWTLKSQNVQKLVKRMTKRDREVFFSDFRELDWDDFFKFYLPGARIHLVKDPIQTLPEAVERYKRLYWIHQATKGVVAGLMLLILWCLLSQISYLIFS